MIFVVYLYFVSVCILGIYGVHRSCLLWTARRSKFINQELSNNLDAKVCVQIPLYNEPYVAGRVIDAVANFEYKNLEIQVLDDSNDETIEIVNSRVAYWQDQGINISAIRRPERKHYKAGALSYGLNLTDAEFVAVFDADFVPSPDFLNKTLPHFSDKVAFVQTRWGHLNRNSNILTRAQAILIDGHFVIEHVARYLKAFFNFNGTAGIWRKSAILDAGGWQGDTITEDLDLSYRARLAGYRAVFLKDVVCLSELPETLSAFKSQQYRWMKGSAQVFKKLIRRILTSNLSFTDKVEAFFHLSGNFCYILMLVTALLLVPVSLYRSTHTFAVSPVFELLLFFFTMVSLCWFYISSQTLQNRKLPLLDILVAVILGVGMGAHCAMASLAGIFGEVGEFVRTPKTGVVGSANFKQIFSSQVALIWKHHFKELLLALYLSFGLVKVLFNKGYLTSPFIVLIISGYLMIVVLGTFSRKQA